MFLKLIVIDNLGSGLGESWRGYCLIGGRRIFILFTCYSEYFGFSAANPT